MLSPRRAAGLGRQALVCAAWAGALGCGDAPREAASVSDPASVDRFDGEEEDAEATGSTGELESSSGDLDELSPDIVEALDGCMHELVDSPSLSGAAVALVHRGDPVWMNGYGVQHPRRGDAVDVDTRFRIGSITKVMTAATAMTLVAEGDLDLDTPFADTLPPFGDRAHPEYTAALTLRQLLSQQGGLSDYLTIDGPRDDEALADAVLGDLFADVPYLVAPGRFYNYSNANYSLAGLLVERAAGVPYRDAVEDRLFGPLQMERSTFDVDAVEADGNYAHGVVEGGTFDARAYDNGWGRPAGFAWSSARDLAALVAFLQRGDPDVLPAWAHAELLAPQVDTLALLDRVHYGLGLLHADFVAVEGGFLEYENIEHDGGLPGYTALVHMAPELELGFAFIANGNDVSFDPCIAAALAEVPGFDARVHDPDLRIEDTDADAFLGDYIEPLSTFGDFTISRAARGNLEVSFPLLDRTGVPYLPELFPITRDNFHVYIDGFPVLVTGIFDDAGRLAYLRTRLFVAHPRPGLRDARLR
jgi:CubicO group peptidase (beta-lactamase class C family)